MTWLVGLLVSDAADWKIMLATSNRAQFRIISKELISTTSNVAVSTHNTSHLGEIYLVKVLSRLPRVITVHSLPMHSRYFCWLKPR